MNDVLEGDVLVGVLEALELEDVVDALVFVGSYEEKVITRLEELVAPQGVSLGLEREVRFHKLYQYISIIIN